MPVSAVGSRSVEKYLKSRLNAELISNEPVRFITTVSGLNDGGTMALNSGLSERS